MIAVLRQGGIESEVDLPRQLFVRPGGAEGPAVEDDFAAIDLQPRDARISDHGTEQQGHRQQEPSHSREYSSKVPRFQRFQR